MDPIPRLYAYLSLVFPRVGVVEYRINPDQAAGARHGGGGTRLTLPLAASCCPGVMDASSRGDGRQVRGQGRGHDAGRGG